MTTQIARFPASLRVLAAEVGGILVKRKENVSVAETAAGGLISAALLSVPGASAYFRGGLTIYTLESRVAFAGWTGEEVKNYKGPTPQIVATLAENVLQKLESTYTVCESGSAGPTLSRVTNKPLGYVALAVARQGGSTVTREIVTDKGGDREANMFAFAEEGLKLLKEVLLEAENIPESSL